MQNNILYLFFVLFFIPINFTVLRKIRIEKKFEQGSIWQIRYAYIVISILVAHFLAEFLINLKDLFQI